MVKISRLLIWRGIVGIMVLWSGALDAKWQENFPIDGFLDRKVWFWEQIFGHYSSDQLVIHDIRLPHIIVDQIDLTQSRYKNLIIDGAAESELQAWFLDNYKTALADFKRDGSRAALRSPLHKRLLTVYQQDDEALAWLLNGDPQLRVQRGLRDRFEQAKLEAARYLSHMERIFRKHRLPVELTRLPFVESMFNLRARSKVGASGIWQFMPATARRYLIVRGGIDERNSPLKATRAAAMLLSRNHASLQSWPLAITAYNHGLNGMKRAVRAVGSRKLSAIIKGYRSASFGFASRNFYSEFVAAMLVYQRDAKSGKLPPSRPLAVAAVHLPKASSLARLLQRTPLSDQIVRQYNPCLQGLLTARRRQQRLPKGYELYVPASIKRAMQRSLTKI